MDLFSILTLIGGLAMFLYGMDLMGKSLALVSGSKLQSILENLTSNRFKGVLLGAGVTAVIQSSSATTVMVVGLVNSGIMKLRQAIGIIMGANIGTSVTAWLLSMTGIESSNVFIQMLKPSSFCPILAIVGVAILMFNKNERTISIGNIMLGFAILMFGMEVMSGAMSPLADNPAFQELFVKFSNPLLGVLVGAGLTALIQSSSASVGILQALCATTFIPMSAVIPIVMGQNIGTCITAILATVGAKRNAKRAATVHLSFNVIGTVIFMLGFYVGDALFDFAFADRAATPLSIAMLHTTFNLINTAILINFTKVLEKLTYLLIPETKEERDEKLDIFAALDERLLDTPSIALEQTRLLSVQMFEQTEKALTLAVGLLDNYDPEEHELVRKIENQIDAYQDRLGSYLLKINGTQFTEKGNQTINIILNSISDIERISDHARSIADVAKTIRTERLTFSPMATAELKVYKKAVLKVTALTLDAYRSEDEKAAMKVEPMEEVIDRLNNAVKVRHIERLRTGLCSIEMGLILSEISTSMERIGDHCSNIAITMIEIRTGLYDAHKYLKRLHKKDADFQSRLETHLKEFQLPEVELPSLEDADSERQLRAIKTRS